MGSGGEPEDESAVDRLILSRLGPTLLAVAAALVSTPFVATAIVTMSASPFGPELDSGPPPIDFAHAVPIALVAVVTAGLIGGAIGGRFVRRAPLSGLLLAVAFAWPVAIATLPIVPTLRGELYATGFFCFDVCTPEIRSGDLLSGLTAYGGSVLAGIISILTATIAIVLAIGAWVARRRDHARVAAVLGLAAYGTFNLVSVLGRTGDGLPFLCLVVGAVIWVAPYWARWERVRPRAATAAGPPAPLVS
ncbi:MAG: hypothetical protein Q7S35_00625 [Candidatus Limnocylindrales bacterium]|nr:hypothetical protein [Candidatus Limnocylindrales bacterium]